MAESNNGKPKAAKKTRVAKPVYAVMSVQDDNGNTIALTKENVTVHGVYRDAEALLALLESGSLPEGSFYKRIALT